MKLAAGIIIPFVPMVKEHVLLPRSILFHHLLDLAFLAKSWLTLAVSRFAIQPERIIPWQLALLASRVFGHRLIKSKVLRVLVAKELLPLLMT